MQSGTYFVAHFAHTTKGCRSCIAGCPPSLVPAQWQGRPCFLSGCWLTTALCLMLCPAGIGVEKLSGFKIHPSSENEGTDALLPDGLPWLRANASRPCKRGPRCKDVSKVLTPSQSHKAVLAKKNFAREHERD